MSRLVNHSNIADSVFIDLISNNPIVVYEEIQGSPIYVKFDGQNVLVKPRNLSNDPLNVIDLAIQKYYGPCFSFFQNLSDRVKGLMNKNWWYEFEYFFDNSPAHIKYDHRPTNGLILTGIVKGKKRTWNIQEITEYANLFEVDPVQLFLMDSLMISKSKW